MQYKAAEKEVSQFGIEHYNAKKKTKNVKSK